MHSITIHSTDVIKFSFGDVVYSVASGRKGIIIAILLMPNSVRYNVVWSDDKDTYCWDIELSKEKPLPE